ncbi:hypothetical protein LRR81_04620 [Metabacillus sp. GX 13764]|uniref:hypothetical protein n=1 Tax=Metabacillus kandeliae TaxID=2900151 RepID=UPI001E3164AE|nr:hypothetical protein [Metabacillus kandeliae]MCD7033505.1 hypothetical protein [Metabacillus kandeliae]
MDLERFVGAEDYEVISFSFSLLHEVDRKISVKELFSENQVMTYITMRVKQFVSAGRFKKALKKILQTEINQLLMTRLPVLLQKHQLLKCL